MAIYPSRRLRIPLTETSSSYWQTESSLIDSQPEFKYSLALSCDLIEGKERHEIPKSFHAADCAFLFHSLLSHPSQCHSNNFIMMRYAKTESGQGTCTTIQGQNTVSHIKIFKHGSPLSVTHRTPEFSQVLQRSLINVRHTKSRDQ